MGSAARRCACICLIAIGAVGLLPGSAGAAVATLGSPNIDESITDFGLGCGSPTCLFVQKKLPGSQVRAPFSGDIFSWQVVSPGVHTYQLVVMRKKKHGKYQNVGQSSPMTTPSAGEYEYAADLHIKKGDYIGLIGDSVQGIINPAAKTLTFNPAVEFPNSKKPKVKGSDEYQFNATMQR